jgi:hypothetical protein
VRTETFTAQRHVLFRDKDKFFSVQRQVLFSNKEKPCPVVQRQGIARNEHARLRKVPLVTAFLKNLKKLKRFCRYPLAD